MPKHKVILGYSQDIAGHLGANGLGVPVECEVIVISPDHNLMFCSQKQVPSMR